ncbi:LamG domain-containing protein [Plantactinospora soyae]|uniref:LamG domain-containing protein n=1 Tax=Plantactinospora soyae TaxID=1544732 RepID=UPI001CEF3CD1|nr:LamG domain-containing protein [Plantactinospora soyae]
MAGLAGLMSTAVLAPEPEDTPPTTSVAVEEELVRDTEAEAAVAAAALGQPVEVLAYRSEYRDVFAQPDGTLVANDHAQAVRVIRDGTWVPTDATLTLRPDGTIASTAALVDARFSGGGTAPLVVVDREGRTLALQWPYSLPAPTLAGDQAVYSEIFPDVDLVVNATIEGFSHVIVLKTPEAASLPELQTLELGVTAVGLALQETENGGVIALDPATGNPVIEADAPVMWDSGDSPDEGEPQPGARSGADPAGHEAARGPSDGAEVAPVDLALANGVLTLTPDAAMLADPATNWPVYLDPVWQATTNSAWAMVDSGYPNEEYYKFDTKRHERIGLCPERCNSSEVKRLFYTVATPYSGRTILTAEFRVTMQHAWNSTPRAASLYLMPRGVSASTNWNNQPGGSNWGSGANLLDTRSPSSVQSTCTSTNQNAAWNALEAVQLAANRGWSSVTLGLKATNEGNSQHSKRFCDNGILSVRYNRAPSIPSLADLRQSPGGGCVFGEGRPFVDVPPRLQAVIRDPDHSSAHTEQVKAEFRLAWTSATGAAQTRSAITPLKASGSLFTYDVPSDIPEGAVIAWDVRGSDNTTWGQWSSEGSRNVCEFEIDRTSPSAPDVDSAELLPLDAEDNGEPDAHLCRTDDEWRGSIGVYAHFTFDSAADDVFKYRYGFNSNPLTELDAPYDGGPVSLRWMPDREGPRWVTVQAVDRAGRSSSIATCTFRVGKRPPTVQWALSDVAGDRIANDPFGGHDATAGSGVTFGVPGPGGSADTAVRLDGTPNGHLGTANNVLPDTSGSFAVTGWVKVSDPSRRQVAISQDGTGEPGFSLGVEGGAWVFRMPVNDVVSLGEWKVTVPGATTNWTYLAAIYDGAQRVMSLQVNDSNAVTAARRSLTKSRGAVQLGRRLTKSGYIDHWAGELADISIFDRLIQPGEIAALKKTAPRRKAYWQFNTAIGTTSPEYAGGAAQTLGAEASVSREAPALLGGGHLALTGRPASYAGTTLNADTAGSFSVATRVRLSSSCAGTPMTVFSLKGAHNSAVSIRCNIEGRWELVVRDSDAAGTEPTVRDTGTPAKTFGKGDHIAVVYNGYVREMLLYVNGELAEAIELISPFQAVGGLQLGRAFVDDDYREHLSGAVDDVRVYDGVADQTLVQRINLSTREQPIL